MSGVPAGVTLAGGDTIFFRGGVHYQSRIWASISGTHSSYVNLIGNKWGTGNAIFDGSVPVTSWTQCASAGQARGNSNFANIWYASIPSAYASKGYTTTYQDDTMLYISQYPNVSDPYLMDNTITYLSVAPSAMTDTSITDARLANLGGSKLIGCVVAIWKNPNVVSPVTVTGWNAGASKIFVTSISASGGGYYTDFNTLYSLTNGYSDSVLDKAGEYYIYDSLRQW